MLPFLLSSSRLRAFVTFVVKSFVSPEAQVEKDNHEGRQGAKITKKKRQSVCSAHHRPDAGDSVVETIFPHSGQRSGLARRS
jgi:hypothetical protein